MSAKNIIFLVVVIAVAAGLGGFFLVQRGSVNLPTSERPMPDLTFIDYQGQEVSLSSFSGKPLIVNAWASWCPFCVDELPDFVSLQEEFSAKGGSAPGGKDLVIIAVNRAESPTTAKNYTDSAGLTDKLTFLLDPSDAFYQAIGGFSMPETVFVNKNGKIVFHKRGPMPLEEMRRRVQDFLLENGNPSPK